ncbi:MAG: sigma factor-like helix-turn-helix DNA-binding protein [Candidatus Paceibacterota bacterium]
MKNIDTSIDNLLSNFSEKQVRVLEDRFGLNGKKLTLQEIGDYFGITRERVRQIEAQAIKELKSDLQKEFDYLIKSADNFLEKSGGVREDNYLINDLIHINEIKPTKYVEDKIRFIFLVASKPIFNKENNNFKAFWYRNKKDKENLLKYVKNTIKYFRKKDKKEILDDKVHLDELDSFKSHNYLSISKKFGTNVFGDFGLKDWPEIEPKVVRDKAYLVLKKKEKPLHFREIAKSINDLGLDKKKMHVQTVHNEVIKDNRFILVGRGTYYLKDSDYEGGTVKDVINKILKQKGPLTQKEVVELVNKKKILKENTIMLNLQNKKHFKRLDDGKYDIKVS